MTSRVIMHVDLDYFYAQCEEHRNPNLRGKPIVVCVYSGRTEESGVVSTSSYEARKYGVKAGIPIFRAKKLLENVDATFLPMDRPHYEVTSERIMELLRAQADSFEQVGIDEAYLDISTRVAGSFDQAQEVASEIKQTLRQQEQMTCSIGIAPNKLLAKIASDHRKPDGLTVIRPEEVNTFLQGLPVGEIPGVGKRVEERLLQLQVRTVDELAKVNTALLVDTFGKSLGSYLSRAARGEDDEPVKDRGLPTQFSRIATLKQNTREPSEVAPLLNELTKSVVGKLKQNRLSCKSIGIIGILTDLSIHSRTKTLDSPTNDEQTVQQITRELIGEFLTSSPSAVLRRVGVKVSGLTKSSGQMDISRFLQQEQ